MTELEFIDRLAEMAAITDKASEEPDSGTLAHSMKTFAKYRKFFEAIEKEGFNQGYEVGLQELQLKK